tara:strand:+ start:13 stop:579 length:567 start_codon:yes stop_codon:yes gene_type:complete
MRIISGNSKGKKILEPKDLNTRPLKDLTKESIFNILAHSNKFKVILHNSNVLDLFSGVGSFGLECLSRGSEHVTFVENYSYVLPVLKKNIIHLGYQKNSLIIEKNIIINLNFKVFERKFDIIFLDPPYKESSLSLILNNIIESNILSNEGIIIIHRHKKEKDKFPEKFNVLEEKTYGISRLIFGCHFK